MKNRTWRFRSLGVRGLVMLLGMLASATFLPQPAFTRGHDEGSQSERDLKAYHSYEAIGQELRALQASNSGIMQLVVIGQSHGDDGDVRKPEDNREIIAVKISDRVYLENDGMPLEEPDILFVGGQHAREWISVEVPFLFIKHLVLNYSKDSKIKELVDGSEIWVVPVANPDGYEYSRSYDRMWRKNRADNGDGTFGVDLNRNFPYALGFRWEDELPRGSLTSTDPSSELYRGPSPFSEPESVALRDLALTHDLRAAVNIHSYGQTILYPWGISEESARDETLMHNLASKMSELIRGVHGANYRATKSFSPGESAGGAYRKHGEMSDWLYSLGVIAFTLELPPLTYGEGGFTLAGEKIEPTFEENLPALLYLIKDAIVRTALADQLPADGATRSLASVIDRNGNHYLDESEMLLLVDYWISGQIVPGTSVVVDDEVFFEYIDKWLANEPLSSDDNSVAALAISKISVLSRQSWLQLDVIGAGIKAIDLEIFNLAGRRLFQRHEAGTQLSFRIFDELGYGLANGVYLYVVRAYGAGGEVVPSAVQKFVILK